MIKINKTEIIILIAVYLFSIYLWTLPFQDQPIPYGEGDATINFFLANHMSSTDKAMVYLPNSTSVWAMHDRVFNPKNYLFYPPQFHTSFAIMQIISNQPIVGFYLYLAIICSSIFFTVYFLIRYLYGSITGLLSSFLIVFSVREHLTYIWGQWGTAFTFTFIPLILYVYYRYTNSVIEKKERPIYIYILALLFVFQVLFHVLGFFLVTGIIGIYTILLIVKERKIPFNLKHLLFGIIIFLSLAVLLQPLEVSQIILRLTTGTEILPEETNNENLGFFESFFTWYNLPSGTRGVPESYFSFKNMYYGYWMLPFLFVGIAYLIFNRKNHDILILSTLIAFYICTHLNLIGIILGARSPRLYYFESIIFYPIITIGVTRLTSFFKFKGRSIVKYLVVAAFVIAVLFICAKPTYTFFNQAYDGIGRLNPSEMEGIDWINNNVPKGSYIMLVGAPTFKQQTWMQALIPEKVIVFDQDAIVPSKDKDLNKTTYLIIDYSFFYLYNDQNRINALLAWEKNNTKEENLKYNQKEMFKVYKLG
jgi:hypothetical protein